MARTAVGERTLYTDWQRWLSARLKAAGIENDVAELARRTGKDYNHLWRLAFGSPVKYRNAKRPSYEMALLVGQALGDVAGSLKAADWTVPDGVGAPLTIAVSRPKAKAAYLDPLAQIGEELDPQPYVDALRHRQIASAHSPGNQPFVEFKDPVELGAVRVFLIRGDCMAPLIEDGDEVVLGPPEQVVDGDVVVALVDGMTTTCKQIHIPDPTSGERSHLQPLNGEGTIPEGRFIVLAVCVRVIQTLTSRLERLKKQSHVEKE